MRSVIGARSSDSWLPGRQSSGILRLLHWGMLPLLAVFALAGADDWRLHYEKSNFLETGRHAEAIDFCKRLDRASEFAKCITIGRSPEGREMVVLLLSKEKAFSPSLAAKSKKPLVFINNGIHSGEIEGKDADLMLARDIVITGTERSLLDGANIMIMPIFSVDAHERFSAFNRINQNGPKEMGWRVTARNLNLNRDFVKADALEMRNLLQVLKDWNPDFFFDNHTTDGGDWQYVVTADVPTAPDLAPEVAAFSRQLIEDVMPRVEKDGFLNAPYFSLNDSTDPSKGISVSSYSPRYSHSYVAALDRPSMLVETHVLKPYKQRVDATYSINKRTIEFIARNARQLKDALAKADQRAMDRKEGDEVILQSRIGPEKKPMVFKGLRFAPVDSPVTGGKVRAWAPEPIDIPSSIQNTFVPGLTVKAPAAYAIPPQWTEVIGLLKLHGISFTTLQKPVTGMFSSHKLEEVKFGPNPFEGRHSPQFKALPVREERTLLAGTVIAPVNQRRGKLLMHLMEPDADDSLVRWGFFNALFERKEYFEDYAMEPYARKMLEADPKLKAEFEEKLKDEAFAKNPRARLQFFYERSEWDDEVLNRHPIVRLTTSEYQRMK